MRVLTPIQIADVKRVLMSNQTMNKAGLNVVLGGVKSYFIEEHSGKSTPIAHEHGKYYFDRWAPKIQPNNNWRNDNEVDNDDIGNRKGQHNKCWVFDTENSYG